MGPQTHLDKKELRHYPVNMKKRMGRPSKCLDTERVFAVLERMMAANGPPSLRELGTELGISHAGAHYWIKKLQGMGYVKRTKYRPRGLQIAPRVTQRPAHKEPPKPLWE